MAQTGSHIHMTDLELEDIQERILELISHDQGVKTAVKWEVGERSSGEIDMDEALTGDQEEFVCMVQLLVYDRILKSVIK